MSSITTINDDDIVGDSNETINDNFQNLNEDKLENSNNLSDVSNAATARSNLGVTTLLDLKADIDGTDPITITVADATNEAGLTITQNDVTNDSTALSIIDNTAFGFSVQVERDSDDTDGPWFRTFHDSASPAANDLVFYWEFDGKTDSGTQVDWAKMFVSPTDVSNASKDSYIAFHSYVANSIAARLVIGDGINGIDVGNASDAGILQSNGNQDLILQTGNATTGNITIVDGANGAINIAPNGSGEAQVGGELILTEALIKRIYKSSDETVNNSTVLQNDDHLSFSVSANERWAFSMFVFYDTNSTADINFGWTYPSGTTIYWSNDDFNQTASTQAQTIGLNGQGSGTVGIAGFNGIIYVSSTPGTIQLQWAQTIQNPSDTKLLAGTYIIAHRLA